MRQVRNGHVQIRLIVPVYCAATTSRVISPHISSKASFTVLDFSAKMFELGNGNAKRGRVGFLRDEKEYFREFFAYRTLLPVSCCSLIFLMTCS